MRRSRDGAGKREGLVLVVVLVVVVLLALAAYQYSELTMAEYAAMVSYTRATQTRAFADSGVHYAAALLAGDQAQTVGGNPWDNPPLFHGVPVGPDGDRMSGRFSILSLRDPEELDGGGAYRFGVADEAAKINLNALLDLDGGRGDVALRVLMGLPNMTEATAAAILDWLDPDDTIRPGGAENETYSLMTPPYRCKNGPLDSLEELLLVKGVAPDLLLGPDRNRNGSLDPDEPEPFAGLDLGWSAYLTVYSRETNANSLGKARINLNGRDLALLEWQLQTAGVEQSVVDFVLAYRLYGGALAPGPVLLSTGGGGGGFTLSLMVTSNATPDPAAVTAKMREDLAKQAQGGPQTTRRIGSVWDLVTRQVEVSIGEGMDAKRYSFPSPVTGDVLAATLPILLDRFTASERTDLRPRVNVNTAPLAVLRAIKTAARISDADLERIYRARPTADKIASGDLAYRTIAWLITDAGLPAATVRRLDAYLCARTQVYRAQSVGYLDRPGPVARVEAVIDTNLGRPRIIFWRDLTEFGIAFPLPGGED